MDQDTCDYKQAKYEGQRRYLVDKEYCDNFCRDTNNAFSLNYEGCYIRCIKGKRNKK